MEAARTETAATFRPLPEARARVTVLLATFNGSRWIRGQIESILAQEGVDVRIVVRDDGSNDSTLSELARFAGDGRIKTAPRSGTTGSAAQNFLALIRANAAKEAHFVAFADQDDIWDRDKLVRACRKLLEDASAGYSSATTAVWEAGGKLVLRPSGPPTESDFLFEGAGQGCTFVLTADLYRKIRSFITSNSTLTSGLHYHDWLMYALARSWNLKWSFDSKPSMTYHQHDWNDTGARGTLKGVVRRLSLIGSGWYAGQLRIIANSCRVAAPANPIIAEWHCVLLGAHGWRRKWQMIRFCLRGGRRGIRDNAVLAMAMLCGLI